MQIITRIVAAAAFVAALVAPAAAAPLTALESDVKHGDFGQNPNQASLFATGTSVVEGAQQNNGDSDYFGFEGFAPGTEKVTFEFTNPGGTWGGLNLRLKTEPFKNKHDWWPLAAQFTVSDVTDSRPRTVSYVLDGYTGSLYAALDFFSADFRSGNGVSYRVVSDVNVAPAPAPAPPAVPLPPSLTLSAAAVGALALMRWRRRAA